MQFSDKVRDEKYRLSKRYKIINSDEGIYYQWKLDTIHTIQSSKFDLKYPGKRLGFEIPDPIIDLESKNVDGGNVIEIKVASEIGTLWRENDVIKDQDTQFVDLSKLERLGYKTKFYRFLDAQYRNNQKFRDEIAELIKKDFQVNEKKKINRSELSSIKSYRDTVYEQLEKNSNTVNEINKDISDVLKVLSHEVVYAKYYKFHAGGYDFEYIMPIEKKVSYINSLRSFFYKYIVFGEPQVIVEKDGFEAIRKCSAFVSGHLVEATERGISTYLKLREPYIKKSLRLAAKFEVLEKILQQSIDVGIADNKPELNTAKKRIRFVEDFYFKNNGSQNLDYGWDDAVDEANSEAGVILFKHGKSFLNARRNKKKRGK